MVDGGRTPRARRRSRRAFAGRRSRRVGGIVVLGLAAFGSATLSEVVPHHGSTPVAAEPVRPCARPDLVLSVPASYSFASLGDFGDFGPTARVAAEIRRWDPAFIVTLGDNGYNPDAPSDGNGGFVWAGSKIDRAVGQWFWEYLGGYKGTYGTGPSPDRAMRFFATLGNHDWDGTPGGAVWDTLPYRSYYRLPGNERTYTVRAGSVQFFVIDSEPRSVAGGATYETNGVSADSVQASWLRWHLADSDARYKVVVLHHPPYTSASRGGNAVVRWPFAEWGASLVVSGHEHQYERLTGPDGLRYVVAGIGGVSLTTTFPNDPAPATSDLRVANHFGALRFDVGPTQLNVTVMGQRADSPTSAFGAIDSFSVAPAPPTTPSPDCAATEPTVPPHGVSPVAVATAPAVRLGTR